MSRGLIDRVLNKVLDIGVFKTLLWTNSAPGTAFSAQAILSGTDLTMYDAIEVHGVNYAGYGSAMPPLLLKRGDKGNLIGMAGSTGDATGVGFLVARGITFGNDRIIISEARGVATNNSQWSTNNSNMIPTRIYGVKMRGGS